MDPRRFAQIDEIFNRAVERDAADRPAFLREVCGHDDALRRTVEQLLAADESLALPSPPVGRPPSGGWEPVSGSAPGAGPDDGELGSRVGRIRLLEHLGTGGMGAVYAGFDEGLGRHVAVKRLRRRHRSPDFRRRLRREARLLSQLNHPHVCQIYDLVEGEETDDLVLELIEGRTLRALLAEGVDLRPALDLGEQIASALAAAHAVGIVHRDLKPENILVSDEGGAAFGQVKVLDFGIARLVATAGEEEAPATGWPDNSFQTPGLAAGTPAYMSPEQKRGEPATSASDLYALGLVLREMAGANVPQELDRLIERFLSPVPSARPTAVEAVERLRWIRGGPRRRLRRLAVVAAVVVLAVVAVGMFSLARRAQGQMRLATAQRLTAQSTLQLGSRLDLALLLALEGHRTADVLETRNALLAALESSPRLGAFFHGHPQSATSVAWSGDGRTLASGGLGDGARLWNAADGSLRAALPAVQGGVLALTWTPGDGFLATAGLDGTVRLWDPATGDPRGVLAGHGMSVWDVVARPAGRILASASLDQTIRLWDVGEKGGGACRAVLRGHTDAVWDLAWDPEGRWLASASSDGTVRLWDPEGKPAGPPLVGHRSQVSALAWSGDGRWLASASLDRTIRFWNPRTGEPAGEPLITARPAEALAWNDAMGLLAAGCGDGRVELWDPAGHRPAGEPLRGHDGAVVDLAWNRDGALVSAGRDGSVIRWDLADRGRTGPLEGHESGVFGLAVSPDGRRLASSSWDQTVRIWDLASGEPLGPPFRGHTAAIFSVAWSPDGRRLVSGSVDRTIRLWDPATGRGTPWIGHEEVVRKVAWSADGSTVASASWDGTVGLWDAPAGRLRARLQGHEGSVQCVAWSADGRLLASGADDGVVRLWTIDGQSAGRLQGFGDAVRELAWRDGRLAAAGHHAVRIWDVASRTLVATLAGGRPEGQLAWNGELLAAGGGEIHLWSTAAGARRALLASFSGFPGNVLSVEWSADGRRLYSGDIDGVIRVRDLTADPAVWRERACQRAGRILTPEERSQYRPFTPGEPVCPEDARPGRGG